MALPKSQPLSEGWNISEGESSPDVSGFTMSLMPPLQSYTYVTYDNDKPVLTRITPVAAAYTVNGVLIPPNAISTFDFVDGKIVGRVCWDDNGWHDVEVHPSQENGLTVHEMFITRRG